MDFLSVEAISSVGFPIAVAAYMIFKFEKTIGENTLALRSLTDVVSGCRGNIYGRNTTSKINKN